LTLVLSIPAPRKIRNGVCRVATKLQLKERLKPYLWGIGVALGVALFDCLSLLNFILEDERESKYSHHMYGGSAHDHLHHQKEKEYKTERNIYLAGFALTLLFVIGRITDLMQEHVELEDDLVKAEEAAHVTTGLAPMDSNNEEKPLEHAPPDAGIEMKPITTKKND